MNNNKEADSRGGEAGFNSKTKNFTGGEKGSFSAFNCNTDAENVESTIQKMLAPNPQIFRLFRCFACGGHFPAKKMSACLLVCRVCFRDAQPKGQRATANQLDRIMNNIRIFLRGRLEVR